MSKELNIKSNKDLLNYLKPVFENGSVEQLILEAEVIHAKMCKEKGLKIDKFTLSHLESITEKEVIFVGEDYFGESLNSVIPLNYFK